MAAASGDGATRVGVRAARGRGRGLGRDSGLRAASTRGLRFAADHRPRRRPDGSGRQHAQHRAKAGAEPQVGRGERGHTRGEHGHGEGGEPEEHGGPARPAAQRDAGLDERERRDDHRDEAERDQPDAEPERARAHEALPDGAAAEVVDLAAEHREAGVARRPARPSPGTAVPAAAAGEDAPGAVNTMRGARPANTNPIAAHITEAVLPTALRSIATSRAPTPGSSPTSTPSRETAHGHPPGRHQARPSGAAP